MTTNGLDEVTFSLSVDTAVPAGTIVSGTDGRRFITLLAAQLPAGQGSGDVSVPAVLAGDRGLAAAPQSADVMAGSVPALSPLLRFVATQPDLPRVTSQCVACALLHDLSFAQWQTFRAPVAGTTAEGNLLAALDAVAILKNIAPERTFQLGTDGELKVRALRHPGTRGKAAQIYGLATPGDPPPAAAVPPDLSQLLHRKPGDNCPICRMRGQMSGAPDQP